MTLFAVSGCGAGSDDVDTPAMDAGADATTEGMEGMGGGDGGGMAGMGDMAEDVPRLPPVLGYYGGEEVFFVHPEASDPEIAGLLGEMMGSPVPVVPALADVPDAAVADVYVFTNGVQSADAPAGPLGFQADVLDSVPGEDGYSPLRRVQMVTWVQGVEARLVTSLEEIREAEAANELTVEDSGAVINAPLLTWPGGQR